MSRQRAEVIIITGDDAGESADLLHAVNDATSGINRR
jgi:hypothetical protein